MKIKLHEDSAPWRKDPEFEQLTPAQRFRVDMVLTGIVVIYVGGRQSGRTRMKNFILKWVNAIEEGELLPKHKDLPFNK